MHKIQFQLFSYSLSLSLSLCLILNVVVVVDAFNEKIFLIKQWECSVSCAICIVGKLLIYAMSQRILGNIFVLGLKFLPIGETFKYTAGSRSCCQGLAFSIEKRGLKGTRAGQRCCRKSMAFQLECPGRTLGKLALALRLEKNSRL